MKVDKIHEDVDKMLDAYNRLVAAKPVNVRELFNDPNDPFLSMYPEEAYEISDADFEALRKLLFAQVKTEIIFDDGGMVRFNGNVADIQSYKLNDRRFIEFPNAAEQLQSLLLIKKYIEFRQFMQNESEVKQ